MFGQRDLVAGGKSVAAVPTLFNVCGCYRQGVSFPFSRREAHPGVSRVVRGMRPSVHPDSAVLFVRTDVLLDRDKLLSVGLSFLPDPHLQGTAIDVGDRVHLALMLLHSQSRRIPAQSPLAGLFIDRKSQVIGQFRTGYALRLILVVTGSPRARQIDLG